ncbi:oligopeptide/dipeptide ABC transporter ATP-binding protein [Nonomuraea sp. NPDC050536]|uniref:oligopeptide/dipeptide ABC transporter ATP-binding protein n=1 Tax=Nonomuraea sp. NPDC050536 TaxID=3364366 RepID=UPI0037C6199B
MLLDVQDLRVRFGSFTAVDGLSFRVDEGEVSDRIAVMYLGEVVEVAEAESLYQAPAHPYTQALLSAVPEIDDGSDAPRRERIVLTGDVPSPIDRPSGCSFHPRCPVARERCRTERPALREVAGRTVACHHPSIAGN